MRSNAYSVFKLYLKHRAKDPLAYVINSKIRHTSLENNENIMRDWQWDWPVSDWGQAGPEQWSASAVGTWWWRPPPRDPATCGKCSPTQRSRPQQTSSGRSASYSNHEKEVGEMAINDCYLFISTGNAFSATKVKWTSTDQCHVFWKTPSVFSLPVEGSGLPNKVNLEVVGDFHRCSNTAPQLDGNFIPIVFKHKLLRKSSIMSYQFLISGLNLAV